MAILGQTAIDFVLLAAAATFTAISIGYIAMLWSMRRNFFIVLRSPRLACAIGLSVSLRFIFKMFELTVCWSDASTREKDILRLISFPAIFIPEVALMLTAVRLLVMFYPTTRARWGRYTRERPLAMLLFCGYAAIELAVWSAAASLGVSRVVSVLEALRSSVAPITIFAAVWLDGRLRKVDDLGSISHDTRCVGAILLGMLCLHAAIHFVWLPALALKYYNITFISVSHPPIIWICIIRPVRQVLHHIPERRRSTAELLLTSPFVIIPLQRRFSQHMIHIAADVRQKPGFLGANRITSIMSFLPLREAFGEFCRRSLCSESFQFLLDVSEFKEDLLLDTASNGKDKKSFKGFGSYFAIVNDYIKDGSHSEVNIAFTTKHDIRKFAKFKDYASLDLDARMGIFSAAEEEVGKMLADNLLNSFLRSAQYKAVVDFEEPSEE